MRVETFSYRYAEEILQNSKYRAVYDEIITICEFCPIAKFSGKSEKQKSKDVVQQVMNAYFRFAFVDAGWQLEPYASPDTQQDELRSDFRKSFECSGGSITVQIEVEFGNVASIYRNYFKFQLSFANNLCDIAILIVPSCDLSKRIDSGVSHYEKVVRELPSAKLTVTVPTLIVGLFDKEENGNPIPEWDVKADGMSLEVAKSSINDKYSEKQNWFIERYYCACFPAYDSDEGGDGAMLSLFDD